jgi:serine protease Do
MANLGIGEVGELLRRSTVEVRAGHQSSGSGVIWSATGTVITNAHVARTNELKVKLWDGRTVSARVSKRDPRLDLAALEIEGSKLTAATVGDSSRLRVGEIVIAVGNPLGFTGALSTGVVHGVGRLRGLGNREWVQAALRLAPGNSGGPLADASGKVAGINTMVISGGLALAIPSNSVEAFLAKGSSAWLGVTVRPVRIGAESQSIGLIVLEVNQGSPAEAASLQLGDILTGANGRTFASVDDLHEALDRTSNGVLALQFVRGDRSKTREVAVRLREAGVAA